jgi:hypothetical protein
MIVRLAAVSFAFVSAFAVQGQHGAAKVRRVDLGKFPIYSVPVRSEDSKDTLDEVEGDFFKGRKPYVESRPSAFYYKDDVDAAKAGGIEPFLVGGVNCDSTIKKAPTITGVPIGFLNERGQGSPRGQTV